MIDHENWLSFLTVEQADTASEIVDIYIICWKAI